MNTVSGANESSAFAALLQRFRVRAGLTQEALAARAGISARGISDLERGLRRYPRRDTLRLLSIALALSGQDRADFEAAALRPSRLVDVQRLIEGQVGKDLAPYRGLRAFREEDAAFFYGRETLSDALASAVSQHNFVAVVGPSGSGKSSVVFAGLLPRLLQSPRPLWEVASIVPGQRPIQTLAAALTELLEPELTETQRVREMVRFAEGLEDGSIDLASIIGQILERQPETDRLLLVIDQWEELYTLTADEAARRVFIDALLAAVDAEPRLTIVLTLRADFLVDVLQHRPLSDRLQDAQLNLSTMTPEEMERAMTEPARKAGVEFEPGLVTRILQDIGNEPGTLPLLEFVLTELWENRSHSRLLNATYEAIGGLHGAVAARAEALFAGLSDTDRARVRHLLLQLVQAGGGTNTRRRAMLDDLGPEVEPLAGKLADNRLLVMGYDEATSEETVELAHEALIEHWGRLHDWIDSDGEFLRWRRRLESLVEQWNATSHDDGTLLRGSALTEAERWYSERKEDIWPAGREYVQQSLTLHEVDIERERRGRRIIIGTATAIVVIVFTLAMVALIQWRSASSAKADVEAALAIAESRELAGRADSLASTQPQLALLLSAEAYARSPTYESKDAMARSLAASSADPWRPLGRPLEGHDGTVYDAVFSPDNRTLASVGIDNTVRLWDTQSGKEVGKPLTGHTGFVRGVAFSPNGKLIATASYDNTVRLWDVATGSAVGAPFSGHSDWVYSVAFSPDGQTLASASSDGTLRLWDVTSHQQLGEPLAGHTGRIYWVAFSPDGKVIASASQDDTVRLWDVQTHAPIGDPLTGHAQAVLSVAFSPDGNSLVSTGTDGTVRVWDVKSGRAIGQPLVGHTGWVYDATFSPDGKTIASVGDDATIRLWDVQTGHQLDQVVTGNTGALYSVAFSSDGSTLVSSSADGTVRLWRVSSRPSSPKTLSGHAGWVYGVAFSPDGKTLASGSGDKTVWLWDVATGQPIGQPMTGHTDWISSVTFSPDGKTLASGSTDDTVRLWDVANQQPIGDALRGHTDWVYNVAFSPDGSVLASASQDGTTRLWDVTSHQPIGQPLTDNSDWVYGVAFNPDGSVLASASKDGKLRLWSVKTGQLLGEPFTGHTGPVASVAFSPDGTMLASAGTDGTVRLWSVATHKAIGDPMTGHAGWIYRVIFSPDGNTLASVGADGTVRLWDVESHQPLGAPLFDHRGSVSGIAFSPDGQTIASSGDDGKIRLWPNPSLESVCAEATGEPLPPIPSYLVGRIDHWKCADLALSAH